ncbi:hypothetical protein MKK67_23800 [Methylobacterium sp. J-072]|uniref:hypothetical protein n=1 Tax=Methylobacterium sp. J-072 TaxID=2836651 RepID=UPI001FB8F4AD|nr:hypothetical protein [Methylobacterium sp. J-072]MCJ2095499.1 hypothetical protein [Methylobacterium sp. J-072]
MRLIGFIILAGMIASQPAVAVERFAHLQPNRETLPPPATEADAQAHPENLAAKFQQDKFDKKIQLAGRKEINSLCASCLTAKNLEHGSNRTRKFNLREGSAVSAESIYSYSRNFDPAQAGGEWNGHLALAASSPNARSPALTHQP